MVHDSHSQGRRSLMEDCQLKKPVLGECFPRFGAGEFSTLLWYFQLHVGLVGQSIYLMEVYPPMKPVLDECFPRFGAEQFSTLLWYFQLHVGLVGQSIPHGGLPTCWMNVF
jgi:hypothetical protein